MAHVLVRSLSNRMMTIVYVLFFVSFRFILFSSFCPVSAPRSTTICSPSDLPSTFLPSSNSLFASPTSSDVLCCLIGLSVCLSRCVPSRPVPSRPVPPGGTDGGWMDGSIDGQKKRVVFFVPRRCDGPPPPK